MNLLCIVRPSTLASFFVIIFKSCCAGYAASRPLEDADSRTLFVSNVMTGPLVFLGLSLYLNF